MPIPARIITTYSSAYAFSPTFAMCAKQMRKLHPRWQHRFFSDWAAREFVRKRQPELLKLYDFYPRPVQKADLFRVIAVMELGGFYLDLDVYLHEALDPLRKSALVLTEEWKMTEENYRHRHRGEAPDERALFQTGNYGFGAQKGHWFLAEVIAEMIRRAEAVNPSTTNQDDVLFTTGPDVFSTVYARHRSDLAEDFILLRGRADAPEPCASYSGGESWWFQFGRFGNHLMSSTWRKLK